MISPAYTIVQLNGKMYREFKSIEISQAVNSHHFFSIGIGSEKIGEVANSFLEKAREFVGTDMALEIQNGLKEKLVFRGVVTRVRSAATSRSELGHTVLIEGYSPTILLDNGKNCQVYLDKNLKNIVEEVCRDFPVNVLNPTTNPMKKDTIPYTIQYHESAFGFLNRLACRYGEWFYFDGQSLVFGNKKQSSIELLYGTDLLSFDIGISVAPLVQSVASRVYTEDNTRTQNFSGQKTNMKGMASYAMNQSSKTFLGKPVAMVHQFNDEAAIGSQMEEVARLSIQGEAARKVTFSGVSIAPALHAGAIISVYNLTGRGKAKQGEYIITSVTHIWSSGGQYQNSFTAIPSDAEVPPMTDPLMVPYCESQPAVVTDNNDPEGLGRVKIRFSWQKYGDSPWVRIAMPYGGSNKGMYFVPEVNEEVMVGFEGGNAEKPFVIGTLCHSKSKPDDWKSDNNDIKAIRTRSGHTIELNDKPGEETITIIDKNENVIKIDTKGNEILISAKESIKFSAKKITIDALEDLSIGAGKNISTSAGEKYNLMAKDINENAENGKVSTSKKLENTSEEITLNSTDKNLTLASGKSVDIQSNEKVKLF